MPNPDEPYIYSPEERYKLGKMLGEAIRQNIEVIAALERTTPHDVFEELLAIYVQERVIDEATGE